VATSKITSKNLERPNSGSERAKIAWLVRKLIPCSELIFEWAHDDRSSDSEVGSWDDFRQTPAVQINREWAHGIALCQWQQGGYVHLSHTTIMYYHKFHNSLGGQNGWSCCTSLFDFLYFIEVMFSSNKRVTHHFQVKQLRYTL
jgi:hypothetical protein